jgi:6-pyruvoyltetrahydropterin/6-carboxytetrahydropterin synthase
MRTRVTRGYGFSAAHVLARPEWSAERNAAVYGKCANPAGHGHNYRVEVTVEGEPDAATGRLVDVAALDALIERTVRSRLDGCFLNRDVSAFATTVPTAENIARHVWDSLEGQIRPARLVSVRLVETPKNSVEYSGDEERR